VAVKNTGDGRRGRYRGGMQTLCRAVAASVLLLLAVHAAPGQVTRWTNPAGGSFGDPANWDNGVPDTTKEGRFELPGAYTVVLDQARTVTQLTSTGADLTLDLGGFALRSSVTVIGGHLTARNGQFGKRLDAEQGAVVVIESDGIFRMDGYSVPRGFILRDTSRVVLRGRLTDCVAEPHSSCDGGIFLAEPGCSVRVEGGVLSAMFSYNQAPVEVIGGSVRHEGAFFPRGLLVDGGGAGGGANTIHVEGPCTVRNGGIGATDGSFLGTGEFLFEGPTTTVGNLREVRGHVTFRGGATALPNSSWPNVNVLEGGSIDLQRGSSILKRVWGMNIRLEPETAVTQLGLGWTGSTAPLDRFVTFVLDGATTPAHPRHSVSFDTRRLGGTLRIEAWNTNVFRVGDEVTILKTGYGFFEQQFDQVELPELDGGRRFEVVTVNNTPEDSTVRIRVVAGGSNPCWSSDFNGDGDYGTDQDIEAFFACIGGTCCALCGSADFNSDGDTGTDQDIEGFFRVLGGHPC